ncbi:MbtH family protein [Dyella subtropica]|uniref:MbtH family protein n=1 Tax=Dyella subtropica TaxID=2992127 RepID=UPI002256DD15|nr:MbtH family protein [Dyella subtropica]
MSSPFDDDSGHFLILVNAENQHSLWPDFADIPAGWRAACLAYVERTWTNMRPGRLIAVM